MPCPLTIAKFTGTISLGLLTGLSYTLSTTTYPALLLLPSALTASKTYVAISTRAQTHALALATTTALAFGSVFAVSPRRIRHPYLLWTAGVAVLSIAPDVYKLARARLIGGPSTLEEQGVNGEMVEERVRKAWRREAARSVVAGFAFAMSVVGIWGEGA